ncbi:hypothetical protein CEXT_564381 [Caerostris extrusa]|uniref:Uncharacterized protein n=1 Tax=Caerostris extrusa TaxID=172846 RepID=A0AAV4XBV0_CAEEX|nr:hypothetical protein CEXT_564381 [Caerostris extrusa]
MTVSYILAQRMSGLNPDLFVAEGEMERRNIVPKLFLTFRFTCGTQFHQLRKQMPLQISEIPRRWRSIVVCIDLMSFSIRTTAFVLLSYATLYAHPAIVPYG